jgi:hypothetical protein
MKYPRPCDLCDATIKRARQNVCDFETMKSIVDLESANGSKVIVKLRIGKKIANASKWGEDDTICSLSPQFGAPCDRRVGPVLQQGRELK